MSERSPADARRSPDQDIVSSWLRPVSLSEMTAALAEAGFSANIYRGCFADLHAQLEDEAAGVLHFLRHGFMEGRVFRVELDLGGLERLRRLPVENRLYLRNLYTALTIAWLGFAVRDPVSLSGHAATLRRLREAGGMPFLVIGDNAVRLWRRADWSGQSWLCPLVMDPIEHGLDALPGQQALLPAPGSLAEPVPILWVFGHAELEWGYLAHRLRERIGPDDPEAARRYVRERVQAYLLFLCGAVGSADRPMHWLAAALPPVPAPAPRAGVPEMVPAALQAEFGAAARERLVQAGRDSLLHLTLMTDQFNQALQAAAAAAGFNVLDVFDRLLGGQGVLDERFQPAQRESVLPDQQATRGIVVTALWAMVSAPRRTPQGPSVREQFEHLLRDIREVQMG